MQLDAKPVLVISSLNMDLVARCEHLPGVELAAARKEKDIWEKAPIVSGFATCAGWWDASGSSWRCD